MLQKRDLGKISASIAKLRAADDKKERALKPTKLNVDVGILCI